MAELKVVWERQKNRIFKKYSKDVGRLITNATVLGMATACIAQMLAIVCNKDIANEQKKYLVPQELADGTINVLLSYILIGTVSAISKKFVSTGKWVTPAIEKCVKKHTKLGEVEIGKISTNLEDVFEKKSKEAQSEFDTCYGNFKNGISMGATTLASIAACNFIAPFGRNEFASWQQKRLLKEDVKKENKTQIYQNNKTYNLSQGNRGLLKI